jgi:mono/diheme cytochrome c family protein
MKRSAAVAVVLAALAGGACGFMEKRSPGEKLWRKRCASCHGLDARGNTPGYMGNVNADLSDSNWTIGSDDGSIETVVREGIFAKMPANDDLTRDEMRALIGHLRALRGERAR